ncbi:antibiotic biosynthesis monooxygenase family protein [Desulfotalea psychrophila]|uniref:ABM domain-containing protein n=1 Tax=Desulfotalea psychrophila (strain LSv54 / DSM 12343) TaxID=177439 RepID=Q6ARK1_DESPS|nr:antibiotic biosynthesis monooxygenase [Desulfotalea psychrophila]CAG35024.1 hypothetical protein DP0295 [Desulfotalea psychrophila LSv54]
MIAVIFEVYPTETGKKKYLELATSLKEELPKFKGLLSMERFQSLIEEKKILSLSLWEDEMAVEEWRTYMAHRLDQQRGKNELFSKYRIRVCSVVRDYSESERKQAPLDSNDFHS